MRKSIWIIAAPFFILISALLVVAGSSAQEPAEAHQAVQVSRDDLRLTIYANDQTLVYDVRTFTLEAGLNRVEFVDVSGNLTNTRTPIALHSIEAPGLFVVDQTLRPRTSRQPFDFTRQLAENLDEAVTLTLNDGTQIAGTLRQVGEVGMVIEIGDGSFRTVTFEDVAQYDLATTYTTPDPTGPTLVATINSPVAGDVTLALTYITTGLRWETAYTVAVGEDNETVEVNGWLTLNNSTSTDFPNASLTIANTVVDTVQFVGRDTAYAVPTQTALATDTAYAPGGGGGGYIPPSAPYTITLPNPITIPMGQTTTELLAGAPMERANVYVYDGSPRVYGYTTFITAPDYGLTNVTSVQNYLSLSTDERDLPGGTLTLYDFNSAGVLVLAGQTTFPYTPAGQGIEIYLDNAETLRGERTQTDFQQLTDVMIQESFAITLTNTGNEDITVQVPERMTRAATWEILGATAPYEVVDEYGVLFLVDVPAGASVTIDYTVVYRR